MVRSVGGTSLLLTVTLHQFQNLLAGGPAPSPGGRER